MNKTYQNILHFAVQCNDIDTLDFLLDRCDLSDDDREALLIEAVSCNRYDIVESLLQDKRYHNFITESVYAIALQYNLPLILKLLLKNDPQLN
jgi:hypothetical protein